MYAHSTYLPIKVNTFNKDIIFNHIINMALRLIFLFFILLHLSKSQNCPLTTRDVEGPFYESGMYETYLYP